MARVHVYMPDRLAEEVRASGLNLSKVAQVAALRELTRMRLALWLRRVGFERTTTHITHETISEALQAAKPGRGGEIPTAATPGHAA